jgi:hypothetical protein
MTTVNVPRLQQQAHDGERDPRVGQAPTSVADWLDLDVVGFDGAGSAPCALALPWVRSRSRDTYGRLSTIPGEWPSWCPRDEFDRAVEARSVTLVVDLAEDSRPINPIPGGMMAYCRSEVLELTGGRWPRLSGEHSEWRLGDSLWVVYATEAHVTEVLAQFAKKAREVLPGALAALLKARNAGGTLDPLVQKVETLARTGLAATRPQRGGATTEKPHRSPRQEFYAYLGAANLIAGRVTATENVYRYVAQFEFPRWSWKAYLNLITHGLIDLVRAWSASTARPTSKRLGRWYRDLQDDQEKAQWVSRNDRELADLAEQKAKGWREELQSAGWGPGRIEQILGQVRERFADSSRGPSRSLTLRDALALATHRNFWLFHACFRLEPDPPLDPGPPPRLRLDSPCLLVRVYDLREAEDQRGEGLDRLTPESGVVTAP